MPFEGLQTKLQTFYTILWTCEHKFPLNAGLELRIAPQVYKLHSPFPSFYRWLLTRSNTCQRKVFLTSYLRSDIFGLRKNNQDISKHVVALISGQKSGNGTFQQSVVRLMNAMASIKSGRDYLGKKQHFYKLLWTTICTFCMYFLSPKGRSLPFGLLNSSFSQFG